MSDPIDPTPEDKTFLPSHEGTTEDLTSNTQAIPASGATTEIPASDATAEIPTGAGVRGTHRKPDTLHLSEETLNSIQQSQIDEHRALKQQKKKRKWPWITAAAVLVVGVAYVGAANYLGDRTPSGTKVAGVNIGNLTRSDAIAKLEADLAPSTLNPVQVVAGSSEVQVIDPTTFSLQLDSAATVDQVVGFSWNPIRLWEHLTGGSRIDPVTTVDDAALTQALETVAAATNVAAQDAAVGFSVPDGDGAPTVSVTNAVVGKQLDVDAAKEKISEEILTASQPIELDVTDQEPSITDEVAESAAQEAQTVISEPLSVTVGGKVVELSPRQLAAASSYTAADGALTLAVDGTSLGDIVRQEASDVLKAGEDARIEIVDHTTPTVIPSTTGVGIDDTVLAQQVTEAVVTTNRTVELQTVDVPASFTTEDANAMGIKEVVSSIDTPLTSDSVRTQNLLVGTSLITNTLVKPDETFSLEKALGEITAERGFTSSGVVVNGFNSTALGGGLSQLSTNTFNLGYLAGLVDVEHQAHSYYFSRYPAGREATLWTGQIDMKWKNNTPYGVVIDTWVADGYVHSQLWSTKYWDVTVTDSGKYNIVQPGTSNNTAADCEVSAAGGVGFTITVTRTVSHDGVVDESLSGPMTWTYQPVNAVTCNK